MKIWEKHRTEGKGSAPQCGDLAPDHRASTRQPETGPEEAILAPLKEDAINLKAREHF